MRFNKVKSEFVKLIKFNLVGVLNTALDFALYNFLTWLGLVYPVAKVISYGVGVVNSYVLNTMWTFRAERSRSGGEMIKFLLVNLVALGVSIGMLYLSKNLFMITSDFWANCIATPVSMAVNYVGNRLFTFKTTAKTD